jgi:translocation and assembly module TamB
MARAIRLIVTTLAVGLAVLLLLGVMAFAVLALPGSGGWIAAIASTLLSGPGMTVEIGHIGLTLPETVTIDAIALRDPKGELLRIDTLAVTVQVTRLFAGRADIRRLDIGTIAVERLPEGGGGGGGKSFQSPLPIAIEKFVIARLDIAEAIGGEAMTLNSEGSMQLDERTIAATIDVHRIDDHPGRLAIDVDYEMQPATLSAKADIEEPTGTALERLIGQKAPLRVRLEGEGPLAQWRGSVTAEAGDRGRLAAELALTSDGSGYALEATGTLSAQQLLPTAYASLIGDTARFALRGNTGVAGRLALDRLRLDVAAGQMMAQGGLDLADRDVSGRVDLAVPDIGMFGSLVPAPLAGAGRLHIDLSGSVDRPAVRLALDGSAVSYAGNRAERVGGVLDLKMLDDIRAPNARLAFAGDGNLENIVLAGAALPSGLGDRLDWRIAGSADLAGAAIQIEELALADAGVTLGAAMSVADGAVEGDATLAIPDPSRLALPLSGATRLAAAFSLQPTGAATARLGGTIDDITLQPEIVAKLLGRHADISATVRRAVDGAITLDDFELSGEAARLTGDGTVPAEFDRFAARLRLEVPDLAAGGGPALSGRLVVDGDLAGPWAAPKLDARVDIAELGFGATRFDRVHSDISVADLSQPAGRIAASVAAGGITGRMRSDFAVRGGDRLAVTGLEIDAAGASIAGSLDVALADRLVGGTISGRIPDLAPFSFLAGTPLAGSAQLKATLTAISGQAVDVTLSGDHFALGTTGAGRLELARIAATGRLTDLFGRPGGRADLTLSGGAAPGGTLDKASLKLTSPSPGSFHFETEMSGRLAAPLHVTASGEATIGGATSRLRVVRFDGTYAGDNIALRRPLLVTRAGDDLSFADLALKIGSGSLSGAGALKGQTISLDLRGENLPAELGARLAGTNEVTGRLGIDAAIGGSLAAPQGTVVVTGSALRFAAASRPELPTLSASARALWQRGRVDIAGRVDAPHQAAIGFSGSAPLALRRPLGIAVAPEGALVLKLEGEGELADIADLLPIGDDRLSGRFALDASVGGTVATPVAGGRMTVSKGRYENTASGTVLSDLALERDGDSQRFVVRRLTAGDGDAGRITGQGSIELAAASEPTLDLRIDLQRFRLARTDEVDATAGGSVRLAGTIAAPQLAADLTLDTAEFRVPERLPASIPYLDVVRVDGRTGQAQAQPARTATAPPLSVALTLRLDAPGQVFVRGRGLDSEWRGNLAIAGTSAAPTIAGSLAVVRGTFSLLGKDFTLTRGTIGFAGATPPDPVLDIVGEASSSDVTVQVLIGGTGSAPTVKLTSQPELPQDEILARLLFGSSLTQISPVQGLELAQAAAQLAGGGGPDILGTVRRQLGLDRLSIGSGSGFGSTVPSPGLVAPRQQQPQSGGLGATTLSAGKYVAPGLYVGVEQGASAGSSAVRVEREITPHVSIDAKAGGSGAQGGESVGINLKMDY